MSLYNFAFINNAATVYFYKSSRKNAKIIKAYRLNHLITKNNDRKISNERLKSHFLNLIEYVSYYSKPNNIDISVDCNEWKNAIIDGKKDVQCWCWKTGRIHFDNFTEAAHWLYFNLFCRIYPYCEIDFTEIEMDPSYKYFLNEFKNKNTREKEVRI